MKKMMISTMAFLVLSTTVMAAAPSRLEDTVEAVTKALVAFEADNTEETVNLYKGLKAAPKSEGVSVSVYLTNRTKLIYACHRHEASEPLECHQSN